MRARSGTKELQPAPVFATVATGATSRLLLVSSHFPPDPAMGSLRWRKLASHAVARCCGLDVIMRDPHELRRLDFEALTDLPAGLRVYAVARRPVFIASVLNIAWRWFRRFRDRITRAAPRVNAVAPAAPRPDSIRRENIGSIWGARNLTRAYFAWLEFAHARRWAALAARLGREIVDREVHRAIISCGPPHEAHDAGRAISLETRLPLIIDLRDAWSLTERVSEWHASPIWLRLATKHERRVIACTSLVVANTEGLLDAMLQAYPELERRMIAVPNGWDEESVPRATVQKRFTIAYAGAIYVDRDPRPLFRAAAHVIRKLALGPADFGIEFMGEVKTYESIPLEQIAREERIEEYVRLHPPRSRQEALEFLSRAAVLVLLPQDVDLAIPGKLFEYMLFDAWLLVLASRGSATEMLLRGSRADVAEPGAIDSIGELLERRYHQHQRGERPARLASDARYSRRAQAERLFEAIEAITGSPEARSAG